MADFGLSAILTAVGTGISAASALGSAIYQKNMADMNARIADDNAKRAIERSQVEQQSQDDMTRGMLGEQEAAMSSSGLSLNSRSSVMTRKAARELGRLDALNIRQAGEIEAYNYKAEAASQRAMGKAALFNGGMNMLSSFIGGTTSMIGGSQSTSKSYDPWVTKRGTNMRYVS